MEYKCIDIYHTIIKYEIHLFMPLCFLRFLIGHFIRKVLSLRNAPSKR